MRIAFETEGEVMIARITEARIDAARTEAFREAMLPAIKSDAPCLRLDMGEVVFLDSTALGAIVALTKRLGPGRRLELAQVGPRLMRIFELTGMNRVLTVHGPGAGG